MNPEKRQRLSLSKSRSCNSKDNKLNAALKSNGNIIDLFKKQQLQLHSLLPADSCNANKQQDSVIPLASDTYSTHNHDDESRRVRKLSLRRTSESVCCTSSSSANQCSSTSTRLIDETCVFSVENTDVSLICIPQRDISVANCIAEVSHCNSGALDDDSTSDKFQLLPVMCHDASTPAGVEAVENDDVINSLAVPYTPYYLESFLLVIDTILNDTFYSYLFSDEDYVAVHAFRNLSG